MTFRTPSADAFAAPRGSAAFLQGKFSGATSPKGPAVQARAVFGGVAPAPPMLRLSGPGRPGRIANVMADKAFPRLRVLRSVPKQCCSRAPRMLRWGIFPAARRAGLANGPTTVLGGGERA